MAMQVPAGLLQFIRSNKKFLVAGHSDPDGDCIGSSLTLCGALRRIGKEAIPCSAGPFKRAEMRRYAERFTAVPSASDKAGAGVIVVDCSALERTGDLEAHLKGLAAAFIDHHTPHGTLPAETAERSFIDPASVSVTVMILSLIEALGVVPNTEETELLFLGLCTDTGFFRHVGQGGADAFAAAAKLITYGANPKAAYNEIYGGRTFESRVLAGRVISRAQTFFDGRLVVTYEDMEDIRQFGIESRDSDSVYQMLQSIAGAEAIALVRQKEAGKCEIGLRSRDKIDVAAIAGLFGGGGHRNAAGCGMDGEIAGTIKKIVDTFGGVFAAPV